MASNSPQKRKICGAKCRDGHACRAKVAKRGAGVFGGRCRLHGGLSTGPRTEAGRATIAASNAARKGTHYKKTKKNKGASSELASVPEHEETLRKLLENDMTEEMKKQLKKQLAAGAARELERRRLAGEL